MRQACLMGIDCGLTLSKAAVFTDSGEKLAEARRSTPLSGDRIDAAALWANVCACIREAAGGLDIRAIGLSAHGNGLYALDGQGNLATARSSMSAGFKAEVSSEGAYFQLAKQSIWPGQPMQLLRRMKSEEPALYERIRTVFLCKDYVRYCLTGELASDYSDLTAAALVDAKGCESPALWSLCGIPEKADALPRATGSFELSGRVSARAAQLTGLKEGTPVSGGLFDAAACMLGAGVLKEGQCSITAGTWGISATPVSAPLDSGLITQNCLYYDRSRTIAVVSAPVSCVNLDWFLRSVRPDTSYDEANAVADSFSPGDVQAIYLPYLYSDMAHPARRAGFWNLSPGDTWREMLRAVYEGVAFAHREEIDRLKGAGCAITGARLSGGAANADAWGRVFAGALGIPLETTAEKQVGVLGAAMSAGIATGLFATPEEAVSAMVRPGKRYEPADSALYEEKYQKFRKAVCD